MKKIFVMMICCGMFQLFASRIGEGGSNFLDPDLYTKTQKKSGGYLVKYNEDLYDLQAQEVLGADEEGYFRTAYEYIMDGDTKLFLSRAVTDLVCVDRKPTALEDLSRCVWREQESVIRSCNHHISAGSRVTQFQLKDGFHIFHHKYTLTTESVLGLENGEPSIISKAVLYKTSERTGQLTGKKGKGTWYNDPAGQGSDGLEPQTELEREAVFRRLFSEYSSLL